jgi:hypothetical protein
MTRPTRFSSSARGVDGARSVRLAYVDHPDLRRFRSTIMGTEQQDQQGGQRQDSDIEQGTGDPTTQPNRSDVEQDTGRADDEEE